VLGAGFRPIRVGYVDFPPLTFEKNGEPAGYLMDDLLRVVKKLGLTISDIELYPAARLFRLLKSGELDMWVGIEVHPEEIAYTASPLATLELNVWTLKGRTLPRIKNVDDLKPYRVALIRGYGYGEWGQTIRAPGSPFRWTDLTDRHHAFKFLEHGRADLLLDYKEPLLFTLPNDKDRHLQSVKVQVLPVKIGVSKAYPRYAELIAALNAELDGT
jgi:polar amino acid transport system substrate-binding protein